MIDFFSIKNSLVQRRTWLIYERKVNECPIQKCLGKNANTSCWCKRNPVEIEKNT